MKAIVKWIYHQSILTITSEHENTPKCVSKEHFLEEIKMLDFSKAIQKSDIPVKLIKENIDRFAEILCKYFNESLEKSIFPDYLKLTNVTPVQNGCTYLKNNYRPLSILPILSKEFFGSILSKFQCGFRKGYGDQNCLLMMHETWRLQITAKLLEHY